jgi:hypothetical protein
VNDVLNTEPGVTLVGTENRPLSKYNYGFAEDRGTARFFTFATIGKYSDGEGWILGEGEYQPEPGGPGFDLIDSELGLANYAQVTFKGVVPIPGAVWLFGSGLIGILGLRRKFRS